MTITLTPIEIGLLVEDTARRFADNINAWPGDAAKKHAARLRELLDTYDDLVAKEKAENEEKRDKACWASERRSSY